jgi:hypothetical protein
MELKIPLPMKLEHDELQEELVKATRERGIIGEAANEVARVLHYHFIKEEEYVLPTLGILKLIANQEMINEIQLVFAMSDRLKQNLPHMLEEHRSIVVALKTLIEAAQKENKPAYIQFANKLMLHAQTEEEVTYPTAILIGEYLKLRLK